MSDASQIEASVARLAARLTDAGALVATAESCTGGWIGKVLTDRPGSSAYFAGGVIAYSNDAKTALLGVKPSILEQHGAVSEDTVLAMAAGAAERFGAAAASAVSGIAGPDGGTASRPVGTVWIGWHAAGRTWARQFRFDGDREAVRWQTVAAAIDGLAAAWP